MYGRLRLLRSLCLSSSSCRRRLQLFLLHTLALQPVLLYPLRLFLGLGLRLSPFALNCIGKDGKKEDDPRRGDVGGGEKGKVCLGYGAQD